MLKIGQIGHHKDKNGQNKKIVNEAKNDVAIANEKGSKLEYHVPTEEKAAQLNDIFSDNGVTGIDIVVTPK